MEDIIAKSFAGFVSAGFGLLAWLFKNTSSKAENAMATSNELKGRVSKLEKSQEDLHNLAVSVGKVETKVENIESTLRRLETYLLEERKK